MNIFIKLIIFSIIIFLILNFIEFFKYKGKIDIKKYKNIFMWIIIFDFVIIIFEKMGINISNHVNQGTNFGSGVILFMFFILSIFTFIPGVIQLIKNNDYRNIKRCTLILGIFFILFLLFRFIRIL